jgi:Tfp pilus assembly protein PilO
MNHMIRQTAFFAVLLAVPLGAWAFVFRPRNMEIDMARADVDMKLIQLEELREVETINDDLEITLHHLESALAELRARIPDAAGIEDVLRRIAEITQENRLVVRSFKREKTVAAAHYIELPMKTVIEGPYHDMTIEKPSTKKMTRGNGGLSNGEVRVEMTITIYADPEKQEDQK